MDDQWVADPVEMQPLKNGIEAYTLLVDGGGRAVEIRAGGTLEGQDGSSGGGGVRAHLKTGPGSSTPAIADERRQRFLQPRVAGANDASEDPLFLDLQRY